MMHLYTTFECTKEAKSVGEQFFQKLQAEGESRRVEPKVLNELAESLEEHLSFALRNELDKRHVVLVDAQIMLELLGALGSVDELLNELNPEEKKTPQLLEPSIPPVSASPGSVKPITQALDEGAEPSLNSKQSESTAKPGIDWRTRFWRKPLCRSSKDRWLFGVCGGFAEFFGVSSTLLRILFLFSGIGFFAYILMGLMLPNEDDLVQGQQVQSLSCLTGFFDFGVKLILLVLVFCPIGVAMGASIFAGFLKVMYELGITGLPGQDSWFYFALGFPGLLSGLASILLGISFLVVCVHQAVATFSGYALIGMNSRKLLVLVAIFCVTLQGGLWGISRLVNKVEAKSFDSFAFPAAELKEILLEISDNKVPFKKFHVEVLGDQEIGSVSVSVYRRSFGVNGRKLCLSSSAILSRIRK